jgi:hypothetical protein
MVEISGIAGIKYKNRSSTDLYIERFASAPGPSKIACPYSGISEGFSAKTNLKQETEKFL